MGTKSSEYAVMRLAYIDPGVQQSCAGCVKHGVVRAIARAIRIGHHGLGHQIFDFHNRIPSTAIFRSKEGLE